MESKCWPVTTALPGIAEAYRKATIAAETTGRIVQRMIEPGSAVVTGQHLLSIDPRQAELAALEADAKASAAKVALASANSELTRGQDLSKKQFISADQLEQLAFAVDSATANLAAANAALAAAQKRLQDTQISAPFDGTVEDVHVHQGDHVSVGTPLLEIVDLSRIRIVAGVTASEASLLAPNVEANIVFSDINSVPLKGIVKRIGHVTDSAAGTYPVEVWLDAPANTVIREGMVANITLPYQNTLDTIAVPAAAIVKKNGRTFVYRVIDQRAILTTVELGRVSAGYVEVISGIGDNEQVVVEGMFVLRDGVAVKTKLVSSG